MIIALSMLSVILGASLACAAQRVPSYNVRLEQSGGALFILGFAMIGATLQHFC